MLMRKMPAKPSRKSVWNRKASPTLVLARATMLENIRLTRQGMYKLMAKNINLRCEKTNEPFSPASNFELPNRLPLNRIGRVVEASNQINQRQRNATHFRQCEEFVFVGFRHRIRLAIGTRRVTSTSVGEFHTTLDVYRQNGTNDPKRHTRTE